VQLIIDQNQTDSRTQTLRINNNNKTELINIANVTYFKGAGDYVEVALTSGEIFLHSDKMTELESNLPSTFLRVHRSYIVNTALITLLERKQTGVGILSLENGETVPVSRRIMPSARDQLV
jgi:DNA-binding LytR/AlgR family response regulator